MSFPSLTKKAVNTEKGFTVIELVVVIFIMIVISTVISSNQSQYTSQATLKNLANNLSLTLRQAQVYGTSVKEIAPNTNNPWTITGFDSGYGVHFNISATGDNTSYIFFSDLESVPPTAQHPNGLYANDMSCPQTSGSECINKTSLGNGYTVSDLCTIISGAERCDITRLDITFVRPNIEAKIYSNGVGTNRSIGCVELSSPDARRMSVVVYTTGQISVRNMTCTDAI